MIVLPLRNEICTQWCLINTFWFHFHEKWVQIYTRGVEIYTLYDWFHTLWGVNLHPSDAQHQPIDHPASNQSSMLRNHLTVTDALKKSDQNVELFVERL